jgi:predicted SAM-dependent methyltransferase
MIKHYLKILLPRPVIERIIRVRKFLRYSLRKRRLKIAIRENNTIKIIVGAAETYQRGWFATNEQWLDITKDSHWKNLFDDKKNISHIVAEHVFEHLTEADTLNALKNMANHLITGGRVRIAVPDGFNPCQDYIKHVCIGGIGDDAEDHKQLLNVQSLTDMMIQSGFEVEHIEGYQSDGQLIKKDWCLFHGFIRRSRKNNPDNSWNFPDASTSLIVDGIKK